MAPDRRGDYPVVDKDDWLTAKRVARQIVREEEDVETWSVRPDPASGFWYLHIVTSTGTTYPVRFAEVRW